jgi:hypothetical protein
LHECVLYILHWTIFLFGQHILMDNLGVSSDICRYCYIYLSVRDVSIYCWLCFCAKSSVICVFLKNLIICLTSFPQYVKLTHFVLWCFGSSWLFCFCGVIVVSQVSLCYIRSFAWLLHSNGYTRYIIHVNTFPKHLQILIKRYIIVCNKN